MRVLLVVPPAVKSGSKIPDLGLAYIATAARKAGHEVFLLQAEEDVQFERIREELRRVRPDVVGLKVYSLEISTVRTAIGIIREELPEAYVVLGGPHISIAPPGEVFGYFPDIDYAIRGEGEIPFPRLLDIIDTSPGPAELAKVPGLLYRDGDEIRANPIIIHPNLDDFDYPAWDLIDPRTHRQRWFFWTPEHPGAPFLTNRGCPYRCTFCAQNVVTGKRVRYRSLENVFTEMEMLLDKYGVRDFDLIDDNFLMDPEFVRGFCEGILERGWKIRWNCCGARLDFVDIDLIKLMERAGCNIIAIGFENGSQKMLDYMKKDLDIDLVRIKAKMVTAHTSIKLMGLFILGFPTETVQDINRTIRYALSLPLTAATFNTFILLPGNEEYERLKRSGEIENVPWEKLGLDAHVYAPKGISMKRLKYLYWKAHFLFYLRPALLWRLMSYSWPKLPVFFKKAAHKLLWKKALT